METSRCSYAGAELLTLRHGPDLGAITRCSWRSWTTAKRQLTLVDSEPDSGPARRVSPRNTGPSPSNQQRAESDLPDHRPLKDSKAKKCLVPCFAIMSVCLILVRRYFLRLCRFFVDRYRQRIGRGQYIEWVSMKHPSHSQNIPRIPSTATPRFGVVSLG